MRPASRRALIAIAIGGGAAAVVPLAGGIAGCMGEGTTCPPIASGGGDATIDAHREAAVDAEAAATQATAGLRLANLSPTSPQIDFCVAECPAGVCTDQFPKAAFQGPLLSSATDVLIEAGFPVDGGEQGLAFPGVSAYVPVASFRAFAVRIVAGGSDCTAGIVPDVTTLPALAAGGVVTIALLGETQPKSTLQAVWLPDDATQRVPDGGMPQWYLRFLHAAPGLAPVDVSLQTNSGSPTSVFSAVPYGKTGMAPTTGGSGLKVVNGYLAAVPCTTTTNCPVVTVKSAQGDAAASPLLLEGTFQAGAGSVITVALVGDTLTSDSGAGAPVELLECVDNAATTTPLGSCTVLSPPP